jgi:hypothetical protein
MTPEELFDNWLEGTVHRETQVDDRGVHVTAAEVLVSRSRGRIDFGGGELEPSSLHPVHLLEPAPGERYGWWRLDGGTYAVRFNETLKEGAPPVVLLSNRRLLDCGGAIEPCIVTAGEIRSLLTVPGAGLSIKENARIGLLRPLS